MDKQPAEVIRELQEKYQPKIIAIAEYDYAGTTPEEFSQTFVSNPEKKELEDVYGGDTETCFEAHRRLGTGDVSEALREAGFAVGPVTKGEGAVRHKAFLIGKRTEGLQSE